MTFLKGSWLLKIVALLCAIGMYYFIHNEMYKIEDRKLDPSYRLIKLTAKRLPVKVRVAANPPDGYAYVPEAVTVNPSHIIAIGPEALLDEAMTAETSLLDLSESTRTVTKKVAVENVAGTHVAGESYLVEVNVPIKKIENSEQP